MKKLKSNVRMCDRVIVRKTNNNLSLYYINTQPKMNEMVYLYTMKASPSIECYFGYRGRTLEELYHFKKWDNQKLAKLISRLPGLIDSALEEYYPVIS